MRRDDACSSAQMTAFTLFLAQAGAEDLNLAVASGGDHAVVVGVRAGTRRATFPFFGIAAGGVNARTISDMWSTTGRWPWPEASWQLDVCRAMPGPSPASAGAALPARERFRPSSIWSSGSPRPCRAARHPSARRARRYPAGTLAICRREYARLPDAHDFGVVAHGLRDGVGAFRRRRTCGAMDHMMSRASGRSRAPSWNPPVLRRMPCVDAAPGRATPLMTPIIVVRSGILCRRPARAWGAADRRVRSLSRPAVAASATSRGSRASCGWAGSLTAVVRPVDRDDANAAAARPRRRTGPRAGAGELSVEVDARFASGLPVLAYPEPPSVTAVAGVCAFRVQHGLLADQRNAELIHGQGPSSRQRAARVRASRARRVRSRTIGGVAHYGTCGKLAGEAACNLHLHVEVMNTVLIRCSAPSISSLNFLRRRLALFCLIRVS